ncbi:MAG: hypothetical protein UX85_C0001G0063 [Candidatus Beckwithbacteria bacterium GW2011_GWB1_47_15]|uniref:Uncharacterized protein n=1 Tax=Candidatus Beckwithbacteria bacterium GW2011_GWB1_47_15 TaxID=1618371 RepID=A0A0G1RX03_9BACT|nr:MAG: hypothetical protein UY43_C0001G1065 [Candidatus Beckwithbacteria bacterium GW2011_GWC1_49_16]AQS30698.1 hypothetical protein [uncultured bacterium]KKU35885.1 MAG: hypothetical protein UX50_C0001G0062 [Candidatus Beckwithbacteria bacterium GW2011_GWA1_46_30]KKU61849.1 MAG: hypothetical protein UX85_C0001G0063 [Candidatus Beckwithbacteria bacterium GW2011_GWB1_47_15]KKU72597.1 MAG: hypothetical protein UX97_C0001G0467 [Candidatus Beckwithbacteria bacterium GW2011_GWA2_47_25]KKW04236.1 M
MISALYEKKLKRDIFRLSLMTLITVVIWIGVATYRAFTKSQVGGKIKSQIIPLTPTLDLDTMELTDQRLKVEPVNWDSLQPVFEVVPETAEPEASLSEEASPSGEATASGSQL